MGWTREMELIIRTRWINSLCCQGKESSRSLMRDRRG
jgi:hypothetical protein